MRKNDNYKIYSNFTDIIVIISIFLLFLNQLFILELDISIIPIFLLILTIIINISDSKLNISMISCILLYIIISAMSILINYFNYSTLEGIFGWVGSIIALLILVTQKIRNGEIITKLVVFISFLVILTSLLDIFNIVSLPEKQLLGSDSYKWLFGNPNTYAMFLSFLFLYLVLFMKSFWKMLFLIILFLLVILSGSRSALISIIVFALSYSFVNYKYYYQLKLKQTISSIVIIAFSAIILVFTNSAIQKSIDFLVYKVIVGGSSGRTDIWYYVIENYIFKSWVTFLFGSGSEFGSIANYSGLSSHNAFLNFISKYGILSLLSFLIIFIFLFFKKTSSTKQLLPVFLYVLVYANVENYFFMGFSAIWTGIILIIVMILNKHEVILKEEKT